MQPKPNPLWLHDPKQIASGVCGEVQTKASDLKSVVLNEGFGFCEVSRMKRIG